MQASEFIIPLLTFIGGGGLVGVFTIRSARKKADIEVKVNEIEAIHMTVEKVYQPLIDRQNERIKELENEVSSLRKQLAEEREARQQERNVHQREMDMMNKRILAISNAIGLKVQEQIRDEKGRYKKSESGEYSKEEKEND